MRRSWENPSSAADKRLRGRALQRLRKRIFSEQPLCAACSEPPIRVRLAEEVDHIIPLSKGGTYDRSNLQGLCRECHEKKTALEQGRKPRERYACGVDVDGWPLDPQHPWRRGK
jgi:5-methylcytosine-specific restriction protein A